MRIVVLLIIYTILVLQLLTTCRSIEIKKVYTPCKAICSLAFIIIAVYCGVGSGQVDLLWQMMPALVLCFAGDVILGFHKVLKDRRFFVAGLLAFLLGHICFVVAFCVRQPLSLVDLIFPILSIGLMEGFSRIPKMHMGRMKPALIIYGFFVSAMFAKGVHLAIMYQSVGGYFLGVGATLFLVSDIILMFVLFYRGAPRLLHVLNLITYYYGMVFIVTSLLYVV